MRRFVGELQHVIEAQARIRHFFLGEVHQPRVDAEAMQRRLQVAGELAQVEEQHAFAPLHAASRARLEQRSSPAASASASVAMRRAELVAQSCLSLKS